MSNALEDFNRAQRAYLATVPKLIGKAVLLETSDNFRRQGAPNDAGAVVPWAPRKSQKEHGRKRKDGQKDRRYTASGQRAILVKTGRLRRSVRIVSVTAESVTVGTDVEYAQAQQEGYKGIPPRPFLTLGKAAQQKLVQQISNKITSLLK